MNKGKKAKCVWLKNIWLKLDDDYYGDNREVRCLTCTHQDCPEYHSETLEKSNCNPDYCLYFEPVEE